MVVLWMVWFLCCVGNWYECEYGLVCVMCVMLMLLYGYYCVIFVFFSRLLIICVFVFLVVIVCSCCWSVGFVVLKFGIWVGCFVFSFMIVCMLLIGIEFFVIVLIDSFLSVCVMGSGNLVVLFFIVGVLKFIYGSLLLVLWFGVMLYWCVSLLNDLFVFSLFSMVVVVIGFLMMIKCGLNLFLLSVVMSLL